MQQNWDEPDVLLLIYTSSINTSSLLILAECTIVKLSEADDGKLKSTLQDLLGLQNARTYTAVNDQTGEEIILTKECANFCQRNCSPARCRPEHTEFYIVKAVFGGAAGPRGGTANAYGGVGVGVGVEPGVEPELLAVSKRSCCGSVVRVTDGKRNEIGRISAPGFSFKSLKLEFNVSSVPDVKWRLTTDRYNAAIWIGKLPVGRCRTVEFQLERNGYRVGSVANVWSGWCREIFSDVDDYQLDIRNLQTVDEKVMLLAAAVFIDTIWFSRACQNCNVRSLVLRVINPMKKVKALKHGAKLAPVLIAGAQAMHKANSDQNKKPSNSPVKV